MFPKDKADCTQEAGARPPGGQAQSHRCSHSPPPPPLRSSAAHPGGLIMLITRPQLPRPVRAGPAGPLPGTLKDIGPAAQGLPGLCEPATWPPAALEGRGCAALGESAPSLGAQSPDQGVPYPLSKPRPHTLSVPAQWALGKYLLN